MKWIVITPSHKRIKLFSTITGEQIGLISAITSRIQNINDIEFLKLIDDMIDSMDTNTINLAWNMIYYYGSTLEI